MGSTHIHLYYHLIWTTYKRFPWINDDVELSLRRLFRDKIIELRSELIVFGSTHDHVHLLVKIHPTKSVAGFVGEIKGYSSFVIANKITPEIGFRWQGGYGALTVPRRDLRRLIKYINNQKEHHLQESLHHPWELPV